MSYNTLFLEGFARAFSKGRCDIEFMMRKFMGG